MINYQDRALTEPAVAEHSFAAPLAGKSALVTGASGAIGKAVTSELVRLGAAVTALDRVPPEHFDSSADDRISFVQLDLSDLSELQQFCDDIIDRRIDVDILVNNAGILTKNKLDSLDLRELHAVNRVNFDAPMLLIQAALPQMKEAGWGRIINMTSFAWKAGGITAGTAYCASKAALTGLTFAVARETVMHGITVNGIAPAYVMSQMVEEGLSAAERKVLLEQIPVGRFCTPVEVAHTVAFIAAPNAGFITGEIVDMNGGLQFD